MPHLFSPKVGILKEEELTGFWLRLDTSVSKEVVECGEMFIAESCGSVISIWGGFSIFKTGDIIGFSIWALVVTADLRGVRGPPWMAFFKGMKGLLEIIEGDRSIGSMPVLSKTCFMASQLKGSTLTIGLRFWGVGGTSFFLRLVNFVGVM